MTTGSIAVVTGAGGGVGRAIAAALAQTGRRLGLVDHHPHRLHATAEALSGSNPPSVVVADITDPADVASAFDTFAAIGPVDLLVNAAGIYGERVRFADAEPSSWWAVVETNLRGPVLCTRAVLPGMVARGRGHILNINSRAATWDDPGQSSVAYSTSKAALARFTSAVAAETAGTGVVVVDLSPGMVRTGMTASREDLAALPDDAFMSLSAVAASVLALASGRYDSLSGRFVHAKDDLDHLAAVLAHRPGARSLTLRPTGPDDPLA